jgi:hypothetical protein
MKMRKKGDIDYGFLKRLLSDLRTLEVKEIGLFYLGESFLYAKLSEAIGYAKQLGFPYLFLTTNGRMATYERVKACVEAGLDSLKFSLNACDAADYRERTGVDSFGTVLQNLRDARMAISQNGHKCGLYASSILFDEEFKGRMKPVLDEIQRIVDEHYWLPLYGQAGLTAGARDTVPTPGNMGRVGALRDSLPCWAVFSEGHVTYDEFLSACCFDHDGRFHMGDLSQIPFMEAWQSQKFQNLRKHHLECDVSGTACQECIACHD